MEKSELVKAIEDVASVTAMNGDSYLTNLSNVKAIVVLMYLSRFSEDKIIAALVALKGGK